MGGLEAARNICTCGQGYFSSSGGDLDMFWGFRWNSSNVCMTKITSYSENSIWLFSHVAADDILQFLQRIFGVCICLNVQYIVTKKPLMNSLGKYGQRLSIRNSSSGEHRPSTLTIWASSMIEVDTQPSPPLTRVLRSKVCLSCTIAWSRMSGVNHVSVNLPHFILLRPGISQKKTR